MFREASRQDLDRLLALDRAANVAALGHVFPPRQHPFPGAEVLDSWRRTVADPAVTVLVVDGSAHLDAVVAYDTTQVHKVAVHPDRWGRGLATRALGRALADMRGRGTETAWLWCLEENHRARRLYEHLGWQDSAEREVSPWPPHPPMVRYTRPT